MGLLTVTNTTLLSVSMLLLRLTLGGVLFAAGAGKVFGWFGGMGIEATLDAFTQMGFSAPLAHLSNYTELIGGLLIAIGLLTRPAAVAVTINMLVATIVTLPQGFLTGASHPFGLMMVSLAVLIAGPMCISIDALIAGKGDARKSF